MTGILEHAVGNENYTPAFHSHYLSFLFRVIVPLKFRACLDRGFVEYFDYGGKKGYTVVMNEKVSAPKQNPYIY